MARSGPRQNLPIDHELEDALAAHSRSATVEPLPVPTKARAAGGACDSLRGDATHLHLHSISEECVGAQPHGDGADATPSAMRQLVGRFWHLVHDHSSKLRVRDIFRQCEADGSGRVSKREFSRALPLLGVRVTPREIDEVWPVLDYDNSGTLDHHKLELAVRTHACVPSAESAGVGAHGHGGGPHAALPGPGPGPGPATAGVAAATAPARRETNAEADDPDADLDVVLEAGLGFGGGDSGGDSASALDLELLRHGEGGELAGGAAVGARQLSAAQTLYVRCFGGETEQSLLGVARRSVFDGEVIDALSQQLRALWRQKEHFARGVFELEADWRRGAAERERRRGRAERRAAAANADATHLCSSLRAEAGACNAAKRGVAAALADSARLRDTLAETERREARLVEALAAAPR
eukprot:g2399.t1